MRRPEGELEADQAIVARVDFRACVLLTAQDEVVEATAGARLMGRGKSLGNTLVVGDAVRFERDGERIEITQVEPRRNNFSRRARSERIEEQMVAANVDQIVLVTSIADPEFSPGFADRVLCQAEHSGIPARLVINKADLGDRKEVEAVIRDYQRAGCAGQAASARDGEGVAELLHACRGRRSLFVGHSGVGKSTVLNAMIPGLNLLAGQVNAKTGKGRHTTTAAWLLRPEDGLELIDTPGVRTFSLWGVGARDLEQSYPEFRPFLGECRFGDCRHDREPGCALRAAIATGHVAARRFDSFLKLREELEQESARA